MLTVRKALPQTHDQKKMILRTTTQHLHYTKLRQKKAIVCPRQVSVLCFLVYNRARDSLCAINLHCSMRTIKRIREEGRK